MSIPRALSLTASTILVIVTLAAAAFLLGPRYLGWEQHIVLSGSMAPTYPTGSVTLVEVLELEARRELQLGDPIMFFSPDDTTQRVTHRIVQIVPDGYLTQGDANDVADPYTVTYDHVIGRVRHHTPYIGFAASYLQNANIGLPLVFAACGLLIATEMGSLVVQAVRARRAKARPTAARGSVRPPDLDRSMIFGSPAA